MKEASVYAAAILASYLLGAIPFGWLAVKVLDGRDLRTIGSGNIGATNAARALGGGWFFPIFALDFLKGFAPVFWLAPLVVHLVPCPSCPAPTALLAAACGAAAIAGHIFPIYLQLKGGKAVATGAGAVFAMNWIAGAACLGLWLVVFFAVRYVSVASVVAALPVPVLHILTWRRTGMPWESPWPLTVLLAILAVVIVARHRDNLGRLTRGEEKKFYFTKGAGG